MLESAQLVAFIPSVDLERSRAFYVDVLGLAPGGDRVAWFKDPDANVLSLTQPAS